MILSLKKRNLKLALFFILSTCLLGVLPFSTLHCQDIDSDLIIKMGFRNDLTEDAGNTAVSAFGSTTFALDRNGNPNCALSFPGTEDDFLKIPVNNENQLVYSDPFTVSLWFRTTATQSPLQLLFTKGPSATSGFEVALFDGNTPLTGDKTFGYGLWDNPWNQDPNLWNDQNWHHLVVVKNDQNHIYLYRDGELRNFDTNVDFNIGLEALDYYIGKDFVGSLDDIRVYKRALTELDVTTLYNLTADCNTTNTECVGFIPFPAGGSYGGFDGQSPGFVVPTFANSEAVVTLEEYDVASGNPTFHTLLLPDFSPFNSILSGIDLDVDFANVPGTVTKVSLDIYSGGSYEFGINGADLVFIDQLNGNIPTTLPGGGTISSTLFPNISTNWDTLHLEFSASDIHNFRFGGLDMAFDNICYEYESTNTCELVNLSATQYCGNDYLSIDFDYANPTNDFFELYLDGVLYETFSFANTTLPLEILLPPNTPPFGTAKVCVNDNPDCCSEIVDVQPIDCNPCLLNDIEIFYEILDCTPNGIFYVDLSVDITNNSDSFIVIGNGQIYGTYSYSNNGQAIGPFAGDGTTVYELGVFDQANPDCKKWIEFGPIDCFPDQCDISNFIVEPWDCQNGEFYADLNFDYTSTSDSFIVQVGGNPIGCYAYSDLWITVGPFAAGNNQFYDFQVVDKENPDCIAGFVLGSVDCPQECLITNLIAETSDCDNNGNYTIDIDFDVIHPTSDNFMVIGDGIFYGVFDYSNLPITLGPFQADPDNGMQFNVFDVDDPACIGLVETDPVDCTPNCNLSNLVIENMGCVNGFNQYLIDFEANNNTGNFKVSALGQQLGTFSYNDLPVIVNLASSINTGADFAICDVAAPNCCLFGVADVLDCGNDCPLLAIHTEAVECIDGEFFILVEVDALNNTGSNGYTLFANIPNGNTYGPFTYAETTQLIGPFSTSLSGPIEIQANDISFSCEVITYQEVPVCNPPCSITELDITFLECTSDSTIAIKIDFDYQNPGNDLFELYGQGGQLVGTFPLGALPIVVDYFPTQNTDYDYLKVCINDNPNCCKETEFETPQCNLECELSNMSAIPVDCANGEFWVKIDFDYQNNQSDQFKLEGNMGTNLGVFSYVDLPIVIGPFPGDGNSTLFFNAYDLNAPNCAIDIFLDAPDCNNECIITNLSANWDECNADGTGQVTINFEVDNPTSDFIDVFFQGDLVGTYVISSPLTINNFPNVGHQQGIDAITVCINDAPNCCKTVDFDVINCTGGFTCIDFEDASAGAFENTSPTAPGSFIWESQGVDINLGGCYNNSPNSYLELRSQFDTGNSCGNVSNSGQTLFGLGAGIELDFSTHNPLPDELSFDFCGEGYLTINGTDSIFFDNTPFATTTANHEIVVEVFGQNTIAGTVTILGTIETLTICLQETTIDNICFNSTPPTPENDCVAFEELEDGFSYDLTNSNPLLLESEGVEVTMLDGISYALATSTPQWTMFNAASGLHLFLGGELEFDFTGVGAPLQFASFDFSGGVQNTLTVNGGNVFEFDFNTPDTVLIIAPNVTLFFNRDATNTVEGNISLFGAVESMVIGGVELAIDNVCYYTDIQEALVWPGDANADNIANHCDLLAIGIAYGEQGPLRANQSTDWNALDAQDWANFFADGITNFKHSDCNGDGMVSIEDLEVLEANYGLMHGPVSPVVSIPGTPNDPPFFVDLESQGSLNPGQQFNAPVNLGSFDIPVNGLYGIAFTIKYDPELIVPGTADIVIKESWLGTPGVDLLSIDKSMVNEGRIEVALSRIDQLNVNGFGSIADFIGVIDDIVAKEVLIEITNVKAIDFSEQDVILHTPASPGVISTDVEDNKDTNGLLVFPVPTSDLLNVHNYTPVDIRLLTVYNALGQRLVQERYPSNKTTIDVSNWPSGIYFIDIKLPDEVITKKFKVTRL